MAELTHEQAQVLQRWRDAEMCPNCQEYSNSADLSDAVGALLAAYEECGREVEGVRRYLTGEQVGVSTGIHESQTYGYGALDANGFWEIPVPEALVELRREVERLKAANLSLRLKDDVASAVEFERIDRERAEQAEASAAKLREAVRFSLDALTDAEQYHSRACAKDKPHDHPLLRKLRVTIPLVDAALAASPEPAPPEGATTVRVSLVGEAPHYEGEQSWSPPEEKS